MTFIILKRTIISFNLHFEMIDALSDFFWGRKIKCPKLKWGHLSIYVK
jgi:hypothetical protein